MENLQTPLLNNFEVKQYNETGVALDIRNYNKNIIKGFDAEADTFANNATPIPNHSPSGNEDLRTTSVKNKVGSIDEIYFEPEFTSIEFRTALNLLAKTTNYCEQSISEFRQGNLIASDDAVHHIQALLPELFCCRNLSESFGAIINSIQNALSNNRGQLLPENKLLALNEILNTVRNEPFMKFDKAIDIIMAFEAHDFIVEPMGFDFLAELLDE